MSMTREEAINWLEAYLADYCDAMDIPDDLSCEVAQIALSALRLVSREQVERMKGVWIFNDDWWEFQCSKCHKGIGNIEKYKFCPHCGAPMTDEAVDMDDMDIKRLEALKDESTTD